VTSPMPLEPDAFDRRHTLFSWAIGLEAAVSFAVPILMLLLGTFFLLSTIVGIDFDRPRAWICSCCAPGSSTIHGPG
jgi:hypothetical protein